MKGCWSVVSFSIHEGFIIHSLWKSSCVCSCALFSAQKWWIRFDHQNFDKTPRVIAQYLQILAIDGFLSFGSLVSVWAYMWLMLESALVSKKHQKTYHTEKIRWVVLGCVADKRSILRYGGGVGGLYLVIFGILKTLCVFGSWALLRNPTS